MIGGPGRRARSAVVAVPLLAALVAGACQESSDFDGASEPTVESVPDNSGDDPGELVEVVALPSPLVEGDVWSVRYRSTGIDGDPVDVTGVIARPVDDPPPEGFPVLSFAHGTTGVADQCAPSLQGDGAVAPYQPYLDAGWVVALTDYEGLGTPGVHPYLVSASEGRSVLDVARAARQLVPEAGSRVVLGGHSQGGHAALAAASVAADWAPELEVLGTIAAAPAADVAAALADTFRTPAFSSFSVLVGASWVETYPELSIDGLLSAQGQAFADEVTAECSPELNARVTAAGTSVLAPLGPGFEPWRARAEENSIDPASVPGPVLVVQGTSDVVTPPDRSQTLVRQLCAAGADATYASYDAGHVDVYAVAEPDMVAWAGARAAGTPVSSAAARAGDPGCARR